METKKNPKYDLRRRSILFFQIGMVLMLFFTWQALEWETADRTSGDSGLVEVADDLDEIIPVTEPIDVTPPPPPPPQVAPEVILVVEDESEVEETIIESSETNQNQDILDIAEIIEEEEEEEIVNVPFAVIEDVPTFPGCESAGNNAAKKECMSKKIQEFVQSRFNTDLAGDLGLEGRQRIFVRFKINKHGNVVDVQARAPHPRLEAEAVAVVNALPSMIPGKQRGRAVGVLYSLPILFQVE